MPFAIWMALVPKIRELAQKGLFKNWSCGIKLEY